MTKRSISRCAIYTRKSHEEGLDQAFNLLDAQYEACKAYVSSQAGLGWNLRDHRYDDGGISGGHMDRPALQELIRDIKAELIDVIVVYKVDRLTRSLTDFAKLVDVFDQHNVSFVSVTQAFNTTTSMGRLTLNVLLSFAQFEREVTAERIRDKFAASKKRGIWMGGTCPIGYQQKDRRLHIVEDEAETVRTIFRLYLEKRNANDVKAELDRLGLSSKRRTDKLGKSRGGQPFSRGAIYWILKNPIYMGKIRHQATLYDGEHDAIIDRQDWERVQVILKSNAGHRVRKINTPCQALLRGLLKDADGNTLVPELARNRGKTYRYYVSRKPPRNAQDSGWRIPAKTIEPLIKDILISTLCSKQVMLELLQIQNPSLDLLRRLDQIGKSMRETSNDQKSPGNRLTRWTRKVVLHNDKISLHFDPRTIADALEIEIDKTTELVLTQPITLRRRGQELKMIIGGDISQTPNPNPSLIELIAKAFELRTGLETGEITSIGQFANQHDMDHTRVKRLLPLGYLAPDIVEAILDGQQPADLTVSTLNIGYKLPIVWADQRTKLGLPPAA